METLNQIFEQGKEELEKQKVLQWCEASAGNNFTFNENKSVFEEIKIIFKTFHEKFTPKLNSKFLGFDSAFPIYPAPVAGLNKVNPKGEEFLVQTCSELGIPTILNDKVSSNIKTLVEKSTTPIFWVLKPFTDIKKMEETIKKGLDAGISGFGINVDVIYGMQSNDKIVELKDKAPSDHNYYEKIREITSAPIFIKGIMHVDDVKKAENLGYDSVVLSNHGGRVLDSLVSPLRQITQIKQHTNIDLYVDGGFRSGLDVFKGLALGSNGILLGRPILYSLACGSREYLYSMFSIMKMELARILGLTDNQDVKEIDETTINF